MIAYANRSLRMLHSTESSLSLQMMLVDHLEVVVARGSYQLEAVEDQQGGSLAFASINR